MISTFNMKYLNEPNMYEVYMLQLLQSVNVIGASLNVSKLMLKQGMDCLVNVNHQYVRYHCRIKYYKLSNILGVQANDMLTALHILSLDKVVLNKLNVTQ